MVSSMTRKLQHKNLISILDLDQAQINVILDEAAALKLNPDYLALKNKIIACCFFEASTRTRLSFEAAVYRLGGNVIGFSEASNTSLGKKGETLEDTIRMISQYADAIVMRHPENGSADRAAVVSDIPVINAGDGTNQHPTQTLLDLFTIREVHGRLDHLKIALVGDLKYGRTVHSLASVFSLYKEIQFYFIAPDALQMPQVICSELESLGIKYSKHSSLEEVIPEVDVIYMTRIQKERLDSDEVHHPIILNASMMKEAKVDACVLHPLPRQAELDTSVDETPQAKYFQQAENGLYVRQALLKIIMRK